MTKRERVREYLVEALRQKEDDDEPLADGDSLVLSGRLSSLDVVNLLTFLEDELDFVMDPRRFDLANFDSVDTIVAMLERTPAQG
jgi:acyl carrier protein